MELYRVVICLYPDDYSLMGSYLKLPSSQPTCSHWPLTNSRIKVCCRPRKVLYKVIRHDANERIAPKTHRHQTLSAVWTATPKLFLKNKKEDLEAFVDSPQSCADTTEAVRQIHRVADYFTPADLTRQLEVICCFSDPSLLTNDDIGQDRLFAALLRVVEYQQGLVTFLCSSEKSITDSGSDSKFLYEWSQLLGGKMVFVDDELSSTHPSAVWRGGLQVFADPMNKYAIGSRVWGFEINEVSCSNIRKQEIETSDSYCISMATSRCIEVVQQVVIEDVCPLAISKRRLQLSPQSRMCDDAARLMQIIRQETPPKCAIVCRLNLYPGNESNTMGSSENLESNFIPGSEQWSSQLANDIRLEQSRESVQRNLPKPKISLLFLLMPLSFNLILLRFPWEIPHVVLTELAELGEDDEDEVESDNWTRWSENLEVTMSYKREKLKLLELPTRPPTEVDLCASNVTSFLDTLIVHEEATVKEIEVIAKKDNKKEKSETVSDHLIGQILKCFNADGSGALTPIDRVKSERRPLIDTIEHSNQLYWPKAINTFYHGIHYNRAAWCEAREERINQIQATAIQHETMCTVTRLGCRGNASSAAIIVPRSEKKKRKETIPRKLGRGPATDICKQQPRSARHEQKLKEVVEEVLLSNGILSSHPCYKKISKNLFDASKTMIKMQNLPNSHNLKEKMKETANLQFHVVKQILKI